MKSINIFDVNKICQETPARFRCLSEMIFRI